MPIIDGGVQTEGTALEEFSYPGAPVNGTDEVQTLTIGGTPTGGTFKLRFEGFVTAAITWSATTNTLVSNIQTALRALPSLGASEVTVADSTLSSGIGNVTITFGGNRGKQAVGLITVESNALTGTAPTLAIAETTAGVSATGRGLPEGTRLFDSANSVWYQNAGTAVAPDWRAFGALNGNVLTKNANYTLTPADSGSVVLVTGADKIITLPATAAGLAYRVILTAAGLSAGTGLQIAPAAADKIMGNGFTSADAKKAILAGSGDREGDAIMLVGDGVDGWYIVAVTGTWTREA